MISVAASLISIVLPTMISISSLRCRTDGTHQFISINSLNSTLPSDYFSSLCIDPKGNIVVGHSQGVSLIDPKQHKVTNFTQIKDGDTFTSPMITQLLIDSRGLLWCAKMSGIDVYDEANDKMYHLNNMPTMACALVEDRHGDIWATQASDAHSPPIHPGQDRRNDEWRRRLHHQAI